MNKFSHSALKNLEPEKCEFWEFTTWEEIHAHCTAQLKSQSKAGGGKDEFGGRHFFLPVLNLLTQRPKFHPLEAMKINT
jgi:hypothetical protein